jgi:hypothetical protein
MTDYDIIEHVHRFSAWVASRAASQKLCRFPVEKGVQIIEAAGLRELLGGPGKLPTVSEIDKFHQRWRNAVIVEAEKRGIPEMTAGVAAKLINVYLKAAYVNTAYAHDPRVAALHPPIDRFVIKGLRACHESGCTGTTREAWSRLKTVSWTQFDDDDYEQMLGIVRKHLRPNQPLWSVEKHWPGYTG